MRIRISWDRGQVIAQLSDSAIARKMSHTLPLRTKAETWGDEIYFKFPVQAELDTDAVDVVEPGEVQVALDVPDAEKGAYGATLHMLDPGKDFMDLMASTRGAAPSWSCSTGHLPAATLS